jgi:hypothetical protein
MDAKDTRRLVKLVLASKDICIFVDNALKHLKWFAIPMAWTKKDLRDFYINHGGKL